VVDERGVILPEMKPLFQKYADRFFVGTDVAHARVYKNYNAHLPRWRSFFSQLSPAAAHKIAYQNAERLFLINK
jgi:predicted TIM-barrel fold metal-dependent hydrolase